MKVVLKIGGSVLFPSLEISKRVELLERWADVINDIRHRVKKLVVVIGGGKIAREYITAAKDAASSFDRDDLGIMVTRVNARLMSLFLKKRGIKVPASIPSTPYEVVNLLDSMDVIILGGYLPGNSTAGVAAITAEAISADLLLFATNVPGIFSDDPRKNPLARKLNEVSVNELVKILSDYESIAGTYFLVDLLALKVIERARIPSIIFDGSNPLNALTALEGFIKGDRSLIFKVGSLIKT